MSHELRPDGAARQALAIKNPFAPSLGLAEAVELTGDTAWNQFQELAARGDAAHAATVPAALASSMRPASASTRPAAATLDQVMLEARRLNRVCPKPPHWVRLYALLPDRRPRVPPPPMTGRTWDETSSLGKRMVLRDQIEWAAARGGLDTVLAFMRSLPEDHWHHMGE